MDSLINCPSSLTQTTPGHHSPDSRHSTATHSIPTLPTFIPTHTQEKQVQVEINASNDFKQMQIEKVLTPE